ncbi:MAG: DNA-directed RNA polymerase subunit omega [Alphaproteobacteria bacterium]|nr:DNA-directed RNA polymerase subunit omega [Alphaproteobacteria bacterium]
MARITVEDCEKFVKNRFELVILAAQRARQIFAGDKVTIEQKKDEKKPVIALREIAENTVSVDQLREGVIEKFRTFSIEEEDDENLDELMEEDTYRPYVGLEMQQTVGSEDTKNISIVDEEEIEEEPIEDSEADTTDE